MKFYRKNLENITKYLIIIIGLIYQISILNYFRYALMGVATLQLIYLIKTNILSYKKIIFIAGFLFILTFILTSLVAPFSIYNIVEIVDIFLLIFGLGNIIDLEKSKKFYRIILHFFIIFTFFMAIVDLAMYVTYFSSKYFFIDHYEYIGMYKGRLWGIFNANMTAYLCFISMAISYIGIINNNKYKKFLGVNLFLNLNVFIFAQSRSAWVGLIIVIASIIFKSSILKKNIYKIIISLLLSICLFFAAGIYNKILIQLPKFIKTIENEDKDEVLGSRDLQNETKLQGRDYLWNKGIEVFEQSPILGSGLYPFKEGVNEYFVWYWAPVVRQAGLHNIYIMVLAVGGVLGFISFLIYSLIIIYKAAKNILIKKISKDEVVIWALIIAIFVQELVESRLFYWFNYYSLIGFLLIGYMMRKIED